MIVEILNSAIEAVVDRIGSEFHELSGRAKDMGSAAVLLSIITAAITGSRYFGRISDEPRGIIKSPVFVQFLVPKSPLTVYTHSITVYTPGGGMKALTTRQQEVFDLIRDHIGQTGMPPTRAEIAQRLGFRSPNAAEEHLKALARKGVIEIVSGASRGIRLLVEEESGIPLVGRVAAGEPLLAQQHIEGHYQVDPGMFKPSADFLLRVSGMSMKDIGILDGDLLAVHKTQDVRNGQVVVARIDDEVTVKRLKNKAIPCSFCLKTMNSPDCGGSPRAELLY